MKFLWILLTLILCFTVTPIASLADTEPKSEETKPEKSAYKFDISNIPFDKTIEEIKEMVDGAEVIEEKEARFVHAGNNEIINKYLGNGIYRSSIGAMFSQYVENDSSFLNEHVKKLTIKYKDDSRIDTIQLYFLISKEGDSKLMLVNKLFISSGDIEDNFKEAQKGIASKLGKNKKVLKSEYGGFPANISVWDSKSRVDILEAHEMLLGRGNMQIISFSKPKWKIYISFVNAFEKAKKTKQEKKIKDKYSDI